MPTFCSAEVSSSVEPENNVFDIYKSEIEPLIEQIREICKNHKFNFYAAIQMLKIGGSRSVNSINNDLIPPAIEMSKRLDLQMTEQSPGEGS